MVGEIPVNHSKVDWSGENPGIYFRDTPESAWTSLAVFFRVVLSPKGRGHAAVILEKPQVRNFCITDNEPLLRYLIEGWLAKFPSFRNQPGLAAMSWLPLTSVRTEGEPRTSYAEIITSRDVEARMVWEDLGEPFAVEVPKQQSATGEHEMYSLFVEAKQARIVVNGSTLPGKVSTRQFFGKTMSTAFLAFSETWLTPER
jgi:hypothetical protein